MGDLVHEKRVPQGLDNDESDPDMIEIDHESHAENIQDSSLPNRSVQGEWCHMPLVFLVGWIPMFGQTPWRIGLGQSATVAQMSQQGKNVIW
ncbi:MAG: hypothetical protein NPIRA06_07410 [Nitrospirales bacterium]|nr:MAG: hypothetical protein NPIRA06_07410 [Nitrospirales bacterium]